MTAALTEAQWQQRVMDTAKAHGWMCVHYRPAMMRSGRIVTPVQGHKGAPDLILARAGVVILAELKTTKGRVSPEQQAWLDALGPYGRLWRPQDWDQVLAELGQRRAA